MNARDDIPTGLRLDELGGSEIVIGRFREHRFPKHSHDGLMLSLIDDGLQRIDYRGVRHLGGRGAVIAVPPEEAHAGAPEDRNGWRYRTITVPPSLLRTLGGVAETRFHCATIIEDGRLAAALDRLFGMLGSAPKLEQEAALTAVLERFVSAHAQASVRKVETGADVRAVDRCRAYLAERLDANVGLVDLAAIAGVDQFRLARAFTRLVGLPPHAWHLQQRLRHAQSLLARGEPTAAVALATGFADQAHLTRAFKRLNGVTPGRYRRENLAHRA